MRSMRASQRDHERNGEKSAAVHCTRFQQVGYREQQALRVLWIKFPKSVELEANLRAKSQAPLIWMASWREAKS